MTMTPDQRFRADLDRLLPEGLIGPLALAVSGGPDSMAMLWLAARALPSRVIAATVDHGLRERSAAEAEAVARWCDQAGVPHATLCLPAPLGRGNRHASARAARYALLADWADDGGARALATAHHADDQAETFLMRAVRGAGPAGLAGVRERRRQVIPHRHARPAATLAVVRPLLRWRRAELAAVALAAGLPVALDPSNDDERFERARMRRLLAGTPMLDATGLAKAARHAGEAEAALAAMEDWLAAARRVEPTGLDNPVTEVWQDMADLPRELRRRLTRRAIANARIANGLLPPFDRATNIEPLLDALEAGRAATQAGVLVTPKGTVWRFGEAPPRRVG